jgi:hypothetical protein
MCADDVRAEQIAYLLVKQKVGKMQHQLSQKEKLIGSLSL